MIKFIFISIIIFLSYFGYSQTEIRGTVRDASTGELLIGKSGSVCVMDIYTGDVVSLVSSPSYDSNKCGSLGELSILSFTPHKIITMGQGGMILTDDENLYNYLISIKTFNRC